jgi:protein gp37
VAASQRDGGIAWCDRTWNCVRGCALVSDGCRNCYAMKQAHRFSGVVGPYEGLTEIGPAGPRWTGKVRLVPEALDEPLRWRKPQRIFVNSMSDLFHEDVPDAFIDRVFAVMALACRHTFQILTKRPERMRAYLTSIGLAQRVAVAMCLSNEWDAPTADGVDLVLWRRDNSDRPIPAGLQPWPLPNVWLGVSAENQKTADERIPLLLQTPAAVRFVSAEPLLGRIDFERGGFALHRPVTSPTGRHWPGLDLIIFGGESGGNARPCHVEWIAYGLEQCQDAGVAAFVKQLGAVPLVPAARLRHHEWGEGKFEWWDNDRSGLWRVKLADRKGGDILEWPEDLRVREMPREVVTR